MLFEDLYVGPALIAGIVMTAIIALQRAYELNQQLKIAEKESKEAKKKAYALAVAAREEKHRVPFYTKSYSETKPGTFIKFH